MFGFGKKSVYIGYDFEIFNKVRTTLEHTGIKYTYHTRGHQGQETVLRHF